MAIDMGEREEEDDEQQYTDHLLRRKSPATTPRDRSWVFVGLFGACAISLGIAMGLLIAVHFSMTSNDNILHSDGVAFTSLDLASTAAPDTSGTIELRCPVCATCQACASVPTRCPSEYCLVEAPANHLGFVPAAPRHQLPTSGPEFDASIVLQYMAVHSAEAFLRTTGDDVCRREYLFVRCCSANYGTSLIRVLTIVKLGIMMNRTVVMVPIVYNEDAMSFFHWHLLTHAQFLRRREIHGCGVEPADFSKLQLEQVNPRLIMPLLDSPDFDCNHHNDHPGLPRPGERGHDESKIYRRLRCEPILTTWNTLLQVEMADVYDFANLLWWNPHWRVTGPARLGLLSIDRHARLPLLLLELASVFLQPARSIRWVLMNLHRSIDTDETEPADRSRIDYIIHLRTKRPHEVYPFIDGAVHYLTDYVNRSATQPDWLAPGQRRKYKFYITSAQYNPHQFCTYLTGNVSMALPGSRLQCYFLDATKFVSQFGLPPDLSLAQVRPQDWDWGVEPIWAAIVNAWSGQYLKANGRLAGLQNSGYAALIRLAGGIESYNEQNQLNRPSDYWPV